MKSLNKYIAMVLILTLCFSLSMLHTEASAVTIVPFQNTIFGSYSVTLSSTMKADFCVTTRKPIASVSIFATMQVYENGQWKNFSTGVSPAFSGSNQVGWDTTADYSSACNKGDKYRISVTYSSSGTSVSCTSGSITY